MKKLLLLLLITAQYVNAQESRIYYIDYSETVNSVSLSGDDHKTILTSFNSPQLISFHNDKLYVSDDNLVNRNYRFDPDGTSGEIIHDELDGAVKPTSVSVYNNEIYFIDRDYIRKSDINGDNTVALIPLNSFNSTSKIQVVNNKIYWSEYTSIHSANLDGTNQVTLADGGDQFNGFWIEGNECFYSVANNVKKSPIDNFSSQTTLISSSSSEISSPEDITVFEGKLYFTDKGLDKIMRANLDGSNIEEVYEIPGLAYPKGIAGNNGYIYWTDSINGGQKVCRIKTDLSGFEVILGEPYGGVSDIAFSDDELIYTGNYIKKSNLNGQIIATLSASNSYIWQTRVSDTDEIYFASDNSIKKTSVNNYDPVTIIASDSPISFFDISKNSIYWVDNDYTRADIAIVYRADLDGSNSEIIYTDEVALYDITFDNEKLYWNKNSKSIESSDIDGTNQQEIYATSFSINGFEVQDGTIYFGLANSGSTYTLSSMDVSGANFKSLKELTSTVSDIAIYDNPNCYVNIPDTNFKAYLINNPAINTTDDDEISCEEASAFTGFVEVNDMGISDLTGVEAFVKATALFCAYNQLTSIDVSKNTALLQLFCNGNQLTDVDVSDNMLLENLGVHENQLTSIDVSNHAALKILYAQNNLLTSLNAANGNNYNFTNFIATGNPDLSCIQVDDKAYSDDVWSDGKDATASFSENCDISTCYVTIPDANFKAYLTNNTSINIDGDTEVSCEEAVNYTGGMFLYDRSISSLIGIEAFVNLTSLNCNANSLTSLDLTKNIALTELLCSDNSLTSLDVTKNIALTQLWCDNNSFTSLDVSQNTVLTELWCNGNGLESIDVSKNIALEWLRCGLNSLTSIDVSENIVLERLDCYNNQLTAINVFANEALLSLSCGNNQIASIDISNNGLLRSLGCSSNSLRSLNIKNTPDLDGFDAINNPDLTCVEVDDVAQSTAMWSGSIDATASFSENCDTTTCYITIPDANFKAYLINNPAINTDDDDEISCEEATQYTSGIYLTDLGISDLTGIEAFVNIIGLYCSRNDLTSLDVSNNWRLKNLYCSNNSLTNLDLSYNNELEWLECYNNSLTSLNLATDPVTGISTLLGVLNALNNPDLTCIQVDASYLDDYNSVPSNPDFQIDDTASYSTDCNYQLSIDDFLLEEVSLYTNPVKEVLKLKLEDGVDKVIVFTLQGKKILESKQKEMIVSNLSPGMYLLKVHTNLGKIAVGRFIKQ